MKPDILKLSCRNFRSYGMLDLNFSSKFVVFFGENGAGKTNILEAISLFSSDRGLRKAGIADLNYIKAASFSWNLELILEKDQYKTFLSTNAQNGRRLAKIDNSNADSLSKFDEMIWILWVIPSMNNIFIGPTADRRSFFDHLVSGYDKRHKTALKTLAKLQKERLHVIFHRKDEAWLNVLEREIAEKSIRITQSRLQFIEILEETFRKHPSDFLRPNVGISGAVEQIYETHGEENSVLEIADMLKKCRPTDSEKQTTSISCQKTFWQVEHQKTTLEAEKCSTGEQKAFLISIILAALRIYQTTRTGIPVLLLDDLMMHLDKSRRKSLVTELVSLNVQTFFTGTDQYLFEDLYGETQIYHVKKSICTAITTPPHV
ncbi:MAG: AAA family ATPase [Holosporaceae bacterium]|jgi:DNA replication and repair protein RecF|nr:AAA family ATPase [Holosporaceae bacterium]